MEPARGDPRGDIDDGGVLVAVLGVPPARLEVDLVHDLRVEQLVQAARDPRGDGDAVYVVRVFGVLPADVDFACGRARGTHDGLLQDLRRRVGGRAVVIILLEDLVAGAGVDGERHGRCDLHRRQIDWEGDQAEIGAGKRVRSPNGDVSHFGAVAQVTNLDAVRSGGHIVDHVAAEGVGRGGGDGVPTSHDPHLTAG